MISLNKHDIQKEYNDWVKAGEIASKVREFSKTIIKPGVKLIDIADQIELKIKELGAVPAFPVNLSHDSFAAHCTPTSKDETVLNNQLLKVDIGVCYNGAIGDTAYTVDLSGTHAKLVEASKKAVDNALKIIKVGTTLGEIGKVIEDTITSYGFQPIRNLSGHGLDLFKIHTAPTVPNYDTKDSTMLEKGMIIAIEPFATTGIGMIEEGKDSGIFKLEKIRNVRTQISKEILDFIVEEYKTLPFTKRWLLKKFPEFKVNFALNNLEKEGIIDQYKQLPEKSKGLVSQAEHTLLIDDKIKILTKR